jgi:hypothetical protein
MKIIKEVTSVLEKSEGIELVIYDNPKECMEAWCQCPLSEIKEWGGYDGDGKEYLFTPEQVLGNITENKCWGFQKEKKSIHIWFDKDCDISLLINLLAHERGHIEKPHHKKQDLEEIKAEKYGNIAVFAYEVAKELMDEKYENLFINRP